MSEPRTVDRVASVGIVLLGLAVVIVAVVALRHPTTSQAAAPNTGHSSPRPTVTASHTSPSHPSTSHTSASSSSPSAPQTSSASSPSASAQLVPLLVLNNTTTTGLAASAQARFEHAGWKVAGIGNLTNSIISTCAYYDPADPAAKAAALALQHEFPTIKRVAPRFTGLPAGPVVVVLTWDYSAA